LGEVIVNLLPLIVGAAVVPLYSIAVLLLLQSKGGLLKAFAFVAGSVTVRLVQGILFGLVVGRVCKANSEPGPRLIVSTLLMIVGFLLLVTALRQWRKQDAPDAPTPQWMSAISGLSALKAIGAGAIFPIIAVKQWVFTLSAIGVIGETGQGGLADVGAYLFFVFATQTLVFTPILAFAVAPYRTAKSLQATQAWLERNNRAIVIVMSLVFGVWFLFKGITGLIV
jgi:Sap, sulfolipid-1-addressing protein